MWWRKRCKSEERGTRNAAVRVNGASAALLPRVLKSAQSYAPPPPPPPPPPPGPSGQPKAQE